MSQTIDDDEGKPVHCNVHGGYLSIGQHDFPFSNLLPMILHYIKGGYFGHALADPRVEKLVEEGKIPGGFGMYLPKKELEQIKEFILRVSSLKETKTESGNILFKEEYESDKSLPERDPQKERPGLKLRR